MTNPTGTQQGPTPQERRTSVPIPRSRVIDLDFMAHRAKVLDVAAFLDRVDRAAGDGPDGDFRLEALRAAIAVLLEDAPGRARRVLEVLSDHSTEPLASAAGMKGAAGAPAPTSSPTPEDAGP